MASKKRNNYHWQLFLPIALGLCVVFGFIIWYQYKREADYRAEMLTEQLELINSRVLKAYEDDQSLRPINMFLSSYFAGSRYEGVRISVYDQDGRQKYSLGIPLPFEYSDLQTIKEIEPGANGRRLVRDENDDVYFLSSNRSNDGKILVLSALPYVTDVDDAIEVDATVWYVIIGCMVLTLVITYYFTGRLARSVVLLKEFTQRVSTGGHFTDADKFPRNELGDISREIIKIYRDRVEAAEQIRKERKVAIHAIEEKARVTRQMTNNINHEIKTPVGIVRGYLESILGDPDMDAATRTRFLERMLSNIERLSNLLNDVSTMTRLENGSDKIAINKVDMYDLVYQIDYDLPINNLAGNLEFSFDIPLECYVSGNAGLLNGMICGLIKNAAMYSGGTKVGLRLISESERYYMFSFWDNGNGVSEEHIPHLFERFYRVDSGRSRKQGGTGLGLPIVKSTVLTMGGSISVHNRTTGGLEFIFSLPRWTD
ncbi:MAG: HAMP domain-containing histidine kinase [Bacteroides sp.]|nr:HAMP domain-containing histidine kinase [Bacteroides sp.]MBD5333057.1 HAMP domain-containing histidine kinase [Bacteroides sp.]